MSPIQAYQAVLNDENLANQIPKDAMGEPLVDLLKIGTDYAEAEAKRRAASSQFQQQEGLNRQIFETIYYGALEASSELSEKLGAYETYEGSPVSKGVCLLLFLPICCFFMNEWSVMTKLSH